MNVSQVGMDIILDCVWEKGGTKFDLCDSVGCLLHIRFPFLLKEPYFCSGTHPFLHVHVHQETLVSCPFP